jgi:hypothetical protein
VHQISGGPTDCCRMTRGRGAQAGTGMISGWKCQYVWRLAQSTRSIEAVKPSELARLKGGSLFTVAFLQLADAV